MQHRQPNYPIERLLINRWSPRAMSGAPMEHSEFMRLIEAARWAPSSFNNQPWRFVYAHRETAAWEKLFNLLVDFNKQWAQNASVLMVLISRDTFEKTGKPSRTSMFDTGSAWENLALQATAMDVVAHAMEGFKYEKAREELGVPDGYTIACMIAVGYPAAASILPEELQEREEPSRRKSISEIACEGQFDFTQD